MFPDRLSKREIWKRIFLALSVQEIKLLSTSYVSYSNAIIRNASSEAIQSRYQQTNKKCDLCTTFHFVKSNLYLSPLEVLNPPHPPPPIRRPGCFYLFAVEKAITISILHQGARHTCRTYSPNPISVRELTKLCAEEFFKGERRGCC